jgi:hypothetical protein
MRDLQRATALVVGVILGLLGFVGFFTGQQVLGFTTNVLGDIVYLLTGLLGIYAFSQEWSRGYNKGVGIFYLALALLGFIAFGFMAGLLNVNTAANVLHLVLGAVLAVIGFGVRATAGRQAIT